MSAGFVQALWRFPVQGMAGETLRSTQIDVRGVAGDGQHYAGGPAGRIGIQDLPELAHWSAAYPFYPDGAVDPHKALPYPTITGPGGGKAFLWGDPRLAFALERSLGRHVELVRDLDAARPIIVSTLEPPIDPAVAGINVQLALPLPDAGGWGGTELIFRDGVRLKLVASRADGPGMEARVVEAGRIAIGEPVTLG